MSKRHRSFTVRFFLVGIEHRSAYTVKHMVGAELELCSRPGVMAEDACMIGGGGKSSGGAGAGEHCMGSRGTDDQ